MIPMGSHVRDYRAMFRAGVAGAKAMGFAPTHVAAAFGQKIKRGSGLRTLWSRLRDENDGGERASRLVDISELVREHFKTKAAVLRWLGRKNRRLGNKSPKALLISGNLSDMNRVLKLLRRMVR